MRTRFCSLYCFCGVDVTQKRQNLPSVAEPLHFPTWAFSVHLDAIVNKADPNAAHAKYAQLFGNANLSLSPIERIGGAGVNAQSAIYSPASLLVNLNVSFNEVLFYSNRLKEAGSLLLLPFLGGFKEKMEHVNCLPFGHLPLSECLKTSAQ